MLMPHVVAQVIVPASGRAAVRAPSEPGGYRLFLRGGASARVRVTDAGSSRVVVSAGETEVSPAVLELSPGAEIVVEQTLGVDRHVKIEQSTCATSLPGIFAIGDIATYPGKLKLILSGFAEAAAAAYSAFPLVHPGEVLHFEYSTTKGVPGAAE